MLYVIRLIIWAQTHQRRKYEGGQLNHVGIHRRMLRRNPKNTEHSPTALWISCDKSTLGPLLKAPRWRGDVLIWICPLNNPQVSHCQWSAISIGSKAGNLALKITKRNALGWRALPEVPMRNQTGFLITPQDATGLHAFWGWVKSQSQAGLEQQTEGHTKRERRLQSQKMRIGHRNDFLWDTDAASGFTYWTQE